MPLSQKVIHFEIPLDWNLSKNKKYVSKYSKALNPKYKSILQGIGFLVKQSFPDYIKAKVWVFIMVYKPTKTGDCSNFVDGVLDGIKMSDNMPDDNYYSGVYDWAIDKENPRIEITIQQRAWAWKK